MIRYQSQNQISIEELKTPFQQKLISDNRWVKLSRIIPWDDLAKAYCKALSKDHGRPDIDAQMNYRCLDNQTQAQSER